MEWTAEEDWALADSLRDFTAGDGVHTVTFWTALVASSAVLYRRSERECEARAAVLFAEQKDASQTAANSPLQSGSWGAEPQVLEQWSRHPDGRLSGLLNGRTVWLMVEIEARLAADPRPGPTYIQSVAVCDYSPHCCSISRRNPPF